MGKKTEAIIAGMLTENVGSDFLDSGGTPRYDAEGKYIGSNHGYGREFERNRGRDFEKESSTVVKFEVRDGELEIEMTHNLYHWLVDRLVFDEELDTIFHNTFREAFDPDNDKYWTELMEEFPHWVERHVSTEDGSIFHNIPQMPVCPNKPLAPSSGKTRRERKIGKAKYLRAMKVYNCKRAEFEIAYEKYREYESLIDGVGGIYKEGEPVTVNTSNGESLLSQVLQYTYFTWNNEVYIILQVHGGADIRGGYTRPRVFQNSHDDETAIFDAAKGTIACTGRNHHPTALNIKEFQETQVDLPGIYVEKIDFEGCRVNWYTDDSCNFYDDGSCGKDHVNLEDRECVKLEEGEDWKPGVICVLDGKAYCPECGALLGAGV